MPFGFRSSLHIGDLNEMILYPLPAVKAGCAGAFDYRLEIPVICVAQHAGKVPARPEFIAFRIDPADGFKGCDFVAHGFVLSVMPGHR